MTVREIKNILDDTINVIIYHNYESKPLMATTLKDINAWDDIEIESIGMSRTKHEVSLVLRLKQSETMVYPIMFNDRKIYYLNTTMEWIDYICSNIKPITLKDAKKYRNKAWLLIPGNHCIFVEAKHGEDKIDLKLRIEEEVNKTRKVNQNEKNE